MKTKRIISSLLVLAMLVGSLVYVVPIGASAADAPPYTLWRIRLAETITFRTDSQTR